MMTWLGELATSLLELLPMMLLRSSLVAALLYVLSLLTRRVSLRVVRNLMLAGFLVLLVPPVELLQLKLPLDALALTSVVGTGRGSVQGMTAAGSDAGWLVLGYPLVVMAILGLMAMNTIRYTRRLKSTVPLRVGFDRISARLTVRQSDSNHSPFLVGLHRPLIVVPVTWNDWTDAERDTVLHHELGHLAHGDNWSAVLSGLVTAVYFFNPLVWLVKDRLELVQELRADLYATQHNTAGIAGFARQLVNVAGTLQHTQVRAPGLALTEPYRRLVHRVNHLFWEGKESRMKQSWIRSFMVIALVVTGLALVSVRGGVVQAAEAVSFTEERAEDVIVKPVPVNKVAPEYPPEARKEGIQGRVVIDVLVDRDGEAVKVKAAESPHDLLTKAAIMALEQWQFKPGTINGEPAIMKIQVKLDFKLDNDTGKVRAKTTDPEAPPKEAK